MDFCAHPVAEYLIDELMLPHPRLTGTEQTLYRRMIAEYALARHAGLPLYLRMQRLFEAIYAEYCTKSVQGLVWYPMADLVKRQAARKQRGKRFCRTKAIGSASCTCRSTRRGSTKLRWCSA